MNPPSFSRKEGASLMPRSGGGRGRFSFRELAEESLLVRPKLAREIGLHLDQRLRVGQVLQSFGSPACWVAAGAQFLMKEITDTNYAQSYAVERDLLGVSDRGGEHRIISELDGSPIARNPIFGMLERFVEAKAGAGERFVRNVAALHDSDINIQRRPRVALVNLQCH